MKIAVEGCAHGELEKIYESVSHIEQREGIKVDLLICCGDFQSTRNLDDLSCMACPSKYADICTFYKYYSGEKLSPILTIFIGGNHEASNYLQELPYGGWVAPNIYYIGYAGVLNVAGIKIAGISGIFKGHDFNKGHFEKSPYNEDTKRSVYHIRNLEVFRLKQLSQPVDIFLSHDWPRGVYNYGNAEQLLKHKPYFKDDIESNRLGSAPCEDLLHLIKPTYWFSAHLHTKFAALVCHNDVNDERLNTTKFLALDKCLPKRRFLQLFDIEHNSTKEIKLEYDLEWLTILYLTNHLISVKNSANYLPGVGSSERWKFTPTTEETQLVLNKFNDDLQVPLNFIATANSYNSASPQKNYQRQPQAQTNPQTLSFCETLGVDDPLSLLLLYTDASTHIESFTSNVSYMTPVKKTEGVVIDSATPLASMLPTPKWIPADKTILSTPSRISMSLPSPRVADIDLLAVSNLDSPSPDHDKTFVKLSDKTLESLDAENKTILISEDCNTSLTPNKKFKRRNEGLYTSTSTDN